MVGQTRAFFIHNPKTGGTSIQKALIYDSWRVGFCISLAANRYGKIIWAYEDFSRPGIIPVWGNHHLSIQQLLDNPLTKDIFNGFTFAFVRNPYDRTVSWFEHWRKRGLEMTFPQWIKHRSFLQLSEQHEFTHLDGKQKVSFIGRFERLEEDYKKIAYQLRLSKKELEHFNNGHHRPYKEYYTRELWCIVTDRFKEDLRLYGYKSSY